MTKSRDMFYVLIESFGPRDFARFATEAAARSYERGLTMQGRASRFVVGTFSADELRSELAHARADYVARLAARVRQAS